MKKRNNTIDFAKLLFIICIVLNHLNAVGNSGENYSIIMRFGYLGVEFFFIVSGYLMTVKAMKDDDPSLGKSTCRFIFKKIGIIYPYYLAAFIIGFISIEFLEKSGLVVSAIHLLRSIPTLMQLEMSGFFGYQILGPTWYLSAMYLSMWILYPLAKKYQETYLFVFAPVISVFCYGFLLYKNGSFSAIQPLGEGFIFAGMIRALGGITLGACCYSLSLKLKVVSFTELAKILFTIFELGAYTATVNLMRTQYVFRPDPLVLIFAATAVTLSFSDISYVGRALDKAPTWIGQLATCMYLADSPSRKVVMLLTPDFSRDERIVPVFIATLIFSIIVMVVGKLIMKLFSFIRTECKPMFVV